ncbi:MAG: DUF4870 domain-containing protein [archaeon]
MKKQDTKDEILWALGAYLFNIIGAIGVLVLAKDKKFARYHAKQSLVLTLVWIVSTVILTLVMWFPIIRYFSWYLLMLLHVTFVLMMVLGILNALLGRQKPLPIIGALAEEIKL